ncbi:MAG TPA: MBL fold metallo-hydrolase [Candidatus Limnocylindrales bacterium]
MRLTVLGSSGAFPTISNPCSGYLVELDGFRILLDAGYSTFRELLRHTTAEAVDAVIFTHGHPDHCADLNPLLRARAMGGGTPDPLALYSPPRALDAVLALDRPGMLDEFFERHEFEPGETLSIGPFTVDTRLLPHSRPNAGLRLTGAGGTTLVYTGDTGPSGAIVELADGADIFIADASYPEHVPADLADTLSSALQAGQNAAAAGVGQLILTHLMPGQAQHDALAAARTHFDGPIAVAASEV